MPNRQASDRDFAPQLGEESRHTNDLKVLTDIAASLSMDVDVVHLLDSFLGTMVRLANARAGTRCKTGPLQHAKWSRVAKCGDG